ncbi:UNVERIFIED_CONTAM: hypothetical protein FKN15_032405 [Acipenser sinensis]
MQNDSRDNHLILRITIAQVALRFYFRAETDFPKYSGYSLIRFLAQIKSYVTVHNLFGFLTNCQNMSEYDNKAAAFVQTYLADLDEYFPSEMLQIGGSRVAHPVKALHIKSYVTVHNLFGFLTNCQNMSEYDNKAAAFVQTYLADLDEYFPSEMLQIGGSRVAHPVKALHG